MDELIEKLTDKQRKFCEEYLIDLCGAQAAIRAGYSTHSAKEIASELLTKPNISAYVDKMKAEQSKRTGINADRVLRELAKIAFINADDLIDTERGTVKDDATENDLSAIASIKVKSIKDKGGNEIEEREVKLHDKTKALELLGKHFKMFTDKVEAEIAPVMVTINKEYE